MGLRKTRRRRRKKEEGSRENEKGDHFSVHSGSLFSSKMFILSLSTSTVHDLHRHDEGGIRHERNANQRGTLFHVPRMCSSPSALTDVQYLATSFSGLLLRLMHDFGKYILFF